MLGLLFQGLQGLKPGARIVERAVRAVGFGLLLVERLELLLDGDGRLCSGLRVQLSHFFDRFDDGWDVARRSHLR